MDHFLQVWSWRPKKTSAFCMAQPLLNLLKISRGVSAPSPERPGPVTQNLLGYWIQNPEAQGTLEAIVEWWLLEQRIQRAAEEVRPVLADLVAKEFVLERQQADGRICYRLNGNKESEIRAWLGFSGEEGCSKPKRGGNL